MDERISARMRDINIEWLTRAAEFDHLFQTRWLGEGFFHLPGDMLAIQELVWRVKPRYIVQTGVAKGGGVLFMASMLALTADDPDAQVIAVEPRLRPDVQQRLTSHRLAHRLRLIQGDSCAAASHAAVQDIIKDRGPVLVVLDLAHTHDHVLRELQLYADLVSPDSYLIVMDTVMEYLPQTMFAGKPYGRGNNPATAVQAFLAQDSRFHVDFDIEDRVIMTLSPGGFLKRAP